MGKTNICPGPGAPINISKDISAKKNIERRDEERKTTFYNFTHPYGKFANPTVRASVTDPLVGNLSHFHIFSQFCNRKWVSSAKCYGGWRGGDGRREEREEEKKKTDGLEPFRFYF